MKHILLLLLGLNVTACVHQNVYTTTRVGPDQFVVASHGRDMGPNNYSTLLNDAYSTCLRAGYQNYKINNVSYDQDGAVIFFQCKKEEEAVETKEESKTDSIVESLKGMIESAKKQIQEKK